jgi:hypothetical protein
MHYRHFYRFMRGTTAESLSNISSGFHSEYNDLLSLSGKCQEVSRADFAMMPMDESSELR